MPASRDVQNAFNAGEISPLLFGRGDLAAYRAGLRRLRNMLPLKTGGVERRPGTLYVSDCISHNAKSRLIPFHVSEDASYVLELSPGKLRIFIDRGRVLASSIEVNGATMIDVATDEITPGFKHGYRDGLGPFRVRKNDANVVLPTGLSEGVDYYVEIPETLTVTAIDAGNDFVSVVNDYAAQMGPFHFRSSVSYPTGLDAATPYYVRAPIATAVKLSDAPAGSPIDITTAGSGDMQLVPTLEYQSTKFRLRTVGGSLVAITGLGSGIFHFEPVGPLVFETTIPYTADQIEELDYSQTSNLLYLVHRDIVSQRITRYGNAAWICEPVQLTDGPYLIEQEVEPNQPIDTTVTIAAAATTGVNVLLTASKAIFKGTDVGRPIRIANNANPLKPGWGIIRQVSAISFTDATNLHVDLLTDAAVNPATDVVSSAGHGFFTGELVTPEANTHGLTAGVPYWIRAIDANSYSIHATESAALLDGAKVDLVDDATSVNLVSSWIRKPAHGLTDRHGPVSISTEGVLPGGLSVGTAYWVEAVDVDALFLTTAPGGPPVLILDNNGSGTHFISGSTLPSTTARCEVIRAFLDTSAQVRWRLGAFSASPGVGFPGAVTQHEQRTIFGGTHGEPQALFGSQTGDLENFAPDNPSDSASPPTREIDDASAFIYGLGASTSDEIEWLESMRALFVGTAGSLWAVQASTLSEAITPTNVNARRQSAIGSSSVKAIPIYDIVAFVEQYRTLVRGAEYRFERDTILAADLQVLAHHMTNDGNILQIAWGSTPWEALFVVRANGLMHSLTFDPDQQVNAWARHDLGVGQVANAVVESVAVSSATSGGGVIVWLSVLRTINGLQRRFIECFAPRFVDGMDREEAHFLDAGIDITLGAPGTVVTGLGHLEGETVAVMADGAVVPSQVVTGGQITLPEPATRIHVGFPFWSQGWQLPTDLTQEAGFPSALSVLRVERAVLRIHRSGDLMIGPNGDESTFQRLSIHDLFQHPMDAPPTLFSGVVEVPGRGGYERDGGFCFATKDPTPLTVLVAVSRVSWSSQ